MTGPPSRPRADDRRRRRDPDPGDARLRPVRDRGVRARHPLRRRARGRRPRTRLEPARTDLRRDRDLSADRRRRRPPLRRRSVPPTRRARRRPAHPGGAVRASIWSGSPSPSSCRFAPSRPTSARSSASIRGSTRSTSSTRRASRAPSGGSRPSFETPDVQDLPLNVLLFVPLGMFVRYLLRRGFLATVAIGAAVSLLIELTQLTGDWGLYPCAYRFFSTSDLITNTVGAGIGAFCAPLLGLVPGQSARRGPSREQRRSDPGAATSLRSATWR